MHMPVAQAYATLEHSSVVELPAYIWRVPGSIPGVPILGKRQRLVVLQKGLFMGRLQKISDEDFTNAVKKANAFKKFSINLVMVVLVVLWGSLFQKE